MSVKDHGLEAIRKSAEEIIPLAEYRLRVREVSSLITQSYDAFTVLYPDAVTEVYEFRVGGIAGTISQTVTLVYTDSTKENLLNGEIS